MKFPSINNLADSAVQTLRRFPLEAFFALAGTIAATIYINSNEELPYSFFTKMMMTANLGLLLSLATTLYTENKHIKRHILVRLAAALLGCCLFFVFNHQLHTADYTRFFLFSLAFHLLVSFAAFTGKGRLKGFWQFNKTLFLRFLASVLFSAVLYIGLAAAIGASNFLFNLHIEGKVFGILFCWIAGIFNTVFFLAGIPAGIAGLDDDDTYPKGLKIFTQYVLIPLASVYVVILLAYEIKILIQWNLPKGAVSMLILGYAVFGMLSILLIYPLREQEGNRWIKTYARSFYFLLVPLLVLLFLAIASRVLPYGITPSRYLLIALAVWLAFVTFYFLLSRKQNIKIIPISLCMFALFSAYGPQGAFSVSKYSQRRILTGIFKKYGALKDGKLSSLKNIKVTERDGQDALERVRYFVFDNGLAGLQPCLGRNIYKVIDSIGKINNKASAGESPLIARRDEYTVKYDEMEWMKNYLGLTRFERDGAGADVSSYFFSTKNSQLQTITGYDYLLNFGDSYYIAEGDSTIKEGNVIIRQQTPSNHVYTLLLNNEKVSFDVKTLTDSLLNAKNKPGVYKQTAYEGESYTVPKQMLSITRQTQHFKVTLQLGDLRFTKSSDNITDIHAVSGYYLIAALR